MPEQRAPVWSFDGSENEKHESRGLLKKNSPSLSMRSDKPKTPQQFLTESTQLAVSGTDNWMSGLLTHQFRTSRTLFAWRLPKKNPWAPLGRHQPLPAVRMRPDRGFLVECRCFLI